MAYVRIIVILVQAAVAYAATALADEGTPSKHYEHGGTVSNEGPDGIVVVWRSDDAADRLAKMQAAGVKPTASDIFEAVACIVQKGTAVSWVDTSNGFPPTTAVIVREGPSKGCAGIVASEEFKADKP